MVSSSNPRLKRTRLAAGSLLALMAVLYVISRSYQHEWPWLEWVKAFAEAGMVGGLADWFAVTALFRHPLGLPIPHTAVIPREKDRIGQALAQFVRGNFLTSERICKQIKELKIIRLLATWLTRPEKAELLAARALGIVPTGLDALEKNNAHHRISSKIIGQLRQLDPANGLEKLINWLLDGQRGRKVLAPLLAQMAHTLEANKEKIESAAGNKAPLSKVPLLGRVSRAVAEDFSSRTTGSIGSQLLAASQNADEPLWETIEEQLAAAKNQLGTNTALREQLQSILNTWLDDTNNNQLGIKIWSQLRDALEHDLSADSPVTEKHLAHIIIAAGQALENDPEMANNIENILTDAIGQILDKHGEHLETMIRETIEEWDANTLMLKLEQQVGPDLQFIRINGTLIGGLVGITLHAVGMLFW
ncbi:MAG: DUF445 domain-containing protein [Akkermansiaceae bacterium]